MRSGIIYKSLRYRNKNKDTETNKATKFAPSKLNIEPIKKRMCGSSAFKARDQVKLISFNNKSQIGSSINFIGEFDPGSGRTLAACLTHASRTEKVQHWESQCRTPSGESEAFTTLFIVWQHIRGGKRWGFQCWTFLVANGWVTRRQPAL